MTGAPKIRAMEIIAELEPVARGPYCGSLGYLGFDGSMDTNILIRTLTLGRGWIRQVAGRSADSRRGGRAKLRKFAEYPPRWKSTEVSPALRLLSLARQINTLKGVASRPRSPRRPVFDPLQLPARLPATRERELLYRERHPRKVAHR